MRIIARPVLHAFWQRHADTEQPLKSWYDEAHKAQWTCPQDIKDRYPSASFIGNNRVVFNIKGNTYRLVVAVAYRFGAVYIKFVGTHAHYNQISVETGQPHTMNIRPIRTQEDYQHALQQASDFFDHEPEPGTPAGDTFEVLLTLIDAYETTSVPITAPDPVEAIRFRMEQAHLNASDLVPSIGQLNRVYEILNRKRELTLPMIRKLHQNLGIPLESLVGV